MGGVESSSALEVETSSFRIHNARAARLQSARGSTPEPYLTANTNLVRETDEVQATRRPSQGPARRKVETKDIHTNENLLNPKEGETPPYGNSKHAFRRQRYNRLTNIKSNGTINIHLDVTAKYLTLDIIIENVIKDND